MNGRDLAKKLKLITNSLSFLYSYLPNYLSIKIYRITCNLNGKFGLLMRYLHLKKNCLGIGEIAYISPYTTIKNMHGISIGNNFSIHEYSYIDGAGKIYIGSNVSIAHNCSIVSFNHTWNDNSIPIKYNPVSFGKITIEDDVWIGCGVRILAGSLIRTRVVIAAGAVVTGELESGYLYGGVPAKKLKKL